ncbi:MAG TPA: lipoyl(octanoyl) transferase LipB [Flavobacteriales bacterium]|nr:lipoyl(octanoyl) transferase LipB [Flavobacteriales bacterium]
MMVTVETIDLGLIDYKEAWDFQEQLFNRVVEEKLEQRANQVNLKTPTRNYLLLCEHPHVYTLGKSGDEKHMLLNEELLKSKNARFYKINRGGDITYHGPGQLVVYPILNLDNFFTDIHKYLRYLEEAVILTLQEYGIQGGRVPGLTGVWLDGNNAAKARKICAMGVKCSRWVTMHGIGFNVNTNLDYFNFIVPCGINDKAVTSVQKELDYEINMEEMKQRLLDNLANIFSFNFVKQLNAHN